MLGFISHIGTSTTGGHYVCHINKGIHPPPFVFPLFLPHLSLPFPPPPLGRPPSLRKKKCCITVCIWHVTGATKSKYLLHFLIRKKYWTRCSIFHFYCKWNILWCATCSWWKTGNSNAPVTQHLFSGFSFTSLLFSTFRFVSLIVFSQMENGWTLTIARSRKVKSPHSTWVTFIFTSAFKWCFFVGKM